jgi:signal peptidase I
VIVNGISMEPGFHKGDLVIILAADSYHVGDIVAYRHPDIGPIIHRIVEQKDDRFVLRGDNNSWLDSYLPVQ